MSEEYHSKFGYPDYINLPTGTLLLDASNHARNEARRDQYGAIKLPDTLKITKEMYRRNPVEAVGKVTKPHIFEIKVNEDGDVNKIGYRENYTSVRDLILVINPMQERIITCWTNLKTEDHEDVSEENYVTP